MKNIFLDCGTHLCEGLFEFWKKGIIDETTEIHSFEPNPACHAAERTASMSLNIKHYAKAVWIEDGFLYFNQENHKDSKSGSPNDGKSDIDGWASSVDGIGFKFPGYSNKIKVESIDFSKFVNMLPGDANIICKMDIEGSEFAVLRKMIQDESIKKIKKIYIEFHSRYMIGESKDTENKIVEEIKNLGVEVDAWS